MTEDEFIALLRPFAGKGARGLADDAAVLGDLVLTHDVIVEGVHFRSEDAPEDVAWKLVAVNLSDLAAKGATPVVVLVGYPLSHDAWDRAFADGLRTVLAAHECALLGGDTVKAAGPRSLSLTAIGRAGAVVPSRGGARDGDAVWVTGILGKAGFGLRGEGGEEARQAYLRPQPRLAEGRALAPLVSAMMDVSDGLLIDAARMAAASGVGIDVKLEDVPIHNSVRAELVEAPSFFPSGKSADGKEGRPFDKLRAGGLVEMILTAATAGDDYELLFTLPPDTPCPVPATRIGTVRTGAGLSLTYHGAPVPLPDRLGYIHQ